MIYTKFVFLYKFSDDLGLLGFLVLNTFERELYFITFHILLYLS